ncbi:acetoacetyl-CoA reductase [Candidatus Bodocaedibacter vickermanii]|uniref:Acetoacetyl-CoA reductase n=1 Tax=Candidatus Bodocaedibacter vickermanii TaxID=2741701 RepID=A0A7L9RVQ1_9PROT|nr:Acetoacetyl-CoA reductase [Candidatus Paracaedibacteraceae bacterium 'Lake Konstanz']
MSKIAVVTGGVRGIGRGISIGLKQAGYTVIATYQSNDAFAKELHTDFGIDILKFDVSDFNSCEMAINTIKNRYGSVQVLVNNAGITKDAALHKMSTDQWQAVIRTNLDSVFNMSRLVIEDMRAASFGRIINISSVNAQKGQAGQTNYCASKAGVLGFTKALALETSGKGITVNAIAPGYIDTDMVRAIPEAILDKIISLIPMQRLGTVDEIAKMVQYLASDEAAYITGSTISLNGGQYMS